MAQPFTIYGPYEIDREQAHKKPWQKEAWAAVDDEVGADLSYAKGVYLFSLRHGKKLTPLYVGMTNKGFRHEVLATHNLLKIAHWKKKKGAIVVHLLAKKKGVHNGFSKHIPNGLLLTLEVLLIFMCRRRNKELENIKNITLLNAISIKGITGTTKQKGKPSEAVQTFKQLLDW
ncbi:hypothetical protein [Tardiphaga robiniae]|uniref:GIY-YIG domain-containing protein n=1 Tax=Tardiphaga robiniae TaxID=943830 RepID=A0A7G6TVP7_9BRAD|nr:hypothetical protein [Tardiphaga robiniae]QND70829.1 hypothetical protein HB776_05950 [Tardiphaga robiniae]